uniref:Uncharacterized protein n=1 Tax=viral metagenome TaxID=1070528 RepID=A0A6C0LLG1_9ZZZZ
MAALTLEEYKEAIFNDISVLENERKMQNEFLIFKNRINNATNFDELEQIEKEIVNKANNTLISGGRHREMNVKDIKELCKANQIKLSRVVDGKRVAYKKKELMTKLKRKKLL